MYIYIYTPSITLINYPDIDLALSTQARYVLYRFLPSDPAREQHINANRKLRNLFPEKAEKKNYGGVFAVRLLLCLLLSLSVVVVVVAVVAVVVVAVVVVVVVYVLYYYSRPTKVLAIPFADEPGPFGDIVRRSGKM